MHSRMLAALVLAAVALVPAIARAAGPMEALRQTGERVRAEGRGLDQMANPDYLARALPDAAAYLAGTDSASVFVDPYRKRWGETRGISVPIEYPNRYGAKIRGHLFAPRLPWRDPVSGAAAAGPLPAIVMIDGVGASERSYWGIDQSLAESGYVVMTFDAQGQGDSELDPRPLDRYCDPHGAWRAPQELGLREHGTCAGKAPATPTPGALGPLADQFASTPLGTYLGAAATLETIQLERPAFDGNLQTLYENNAPNFALGALDAVAWLRSSANPMRAQIDLGRVGVMGHSLGGYGALLAGNEDPQHRFAAVVAYDEHGQPPAGFTPAVPTQLQLSERAQHSLPALPTARSFDDHPSAEVGARFRRTGVDSMQVALRGSTHQEWSYTSFQLANPVAGPFTNQSSEGERVGVYYALAWFDRFLKGRDLTHSPGEAAEQGDADRRLLARRFDDSADRSSIGQGRFSLRTLSNLPYTVAGERVRGHLSPLLRSAYDYAGHTCLDMQDGC